MDYSNYIKDIRASIFNDVEDTDNYYDFILNHNIKYIVTQAVGKYHISHFIYSIFNLYGRSYRFLDDKDNLLLAIRVQTSDVRSDTYDYFFKTVFSLKLECEIICEAESFKKDSIIFLIKIPAKIFKEPNICNCCNCIYGSFEGTICHLSKPLVSRTYVCESYLNDNFDKERFIKEFTDMI